MTEAIYFDSNEGDPTGGYLLWLPASVEGLNRIPGGPAEGMVVDLCMPNELVCRARLTIDKEFGCWKGMPLPGTTKVIYPES